MKLFICEICGDAYIGEEKPADCPFCGAPNNYIKDGKEAQPIVLKDLTLDEKSRENLEKTYDLEVRAAAIYTCMAGKAKSYEVKAMFKRLAKIELEHAVIATKILKKEAPKTVEEICSDEDLENFKKTVELETHASGLYDEFAKSSENTDIRILFTALAQAERGHLELMKNFL